MKSSNRMPVRSVVRAVVAALSLGAMGAAQAGEDDTPLYLSAAHTITRDSNFSRNSESQGETINSSALQVGIDKAYGRQSYRGSAKLSKSSYAHYGDLLNNDGKNLNGTVSSEFLRDWRVTLGGAYTESLNQIADNNDTANRVVRNIRRYRDGNVALQYGIGGLYSIAATYDANKLKYSAPSYQANNANQRTSGLRGVYNSTDLLNFGLGYRLVRTRFPGYATEENQTDRNLDFSTNWQVTGLSKLNAMLTRRSSVYSSNADRTVRGWTGDLDWVYTPSGLITYGVGLQRATGADRDSNDVKAERFNFNSRQATTTDNNNVTTSLDLSAKMLLTGKLTASAAYKLARYAIDNTNIGSTTTCTLAGCVTQAINTLNKSSSIAHTSTLGVNYAVTRAVNLGCSYQRYDQSVGGNRVAYDGHSVDCSASLTID